MRGSCAQAGVGRVQVREEAECVSYAGLAVEHRLGGLQRRRRVTQAQVDVREVEKRRHAHPAVVLRALLLRARRRRTRRPTTRRRARRRRRRRGLCVRAGVGGASVQQEDAVLEARARVLQRQIDLRLGVGDAARR